MDFRELIALAAPVLTEPITWKPLLAAVSRIRRRYRRQKARRVLGYQGPIRRMAKRAFRK